MELVIDPTQSYEENCEKAGEFFRAFLPTSFTSSELASILKKNLTVAVPTALAYATWSFAVDHPLQLEALTSMLKSTFESDQVEKLKVPDGANGPESPFNILVWTLGDTVRSYGHHTPDYTENQIWVDRFDGEGQQLHPRITSAFITAASRKLDFMKFGDWYSMTLEGLQMCDWEVPDDADAQQISAIASLIFFSTIGAEQFASTMFLADKGETYDTVVNALKEIKKKNIVRYEPAVALLDRVISDVETHDKQERSLAEVWKLLFDSS